MEQPSFSFLSTLRRPSAFLPLLMSYSALALVLGTITLQGVAHDADEGPVAHLWQLLMVGQAPIVLFFAVRWMRRTPQQVLEVLALQIVAALASMAPVLYFHL